MQLPFTHEQFLDLFGQYNRTLWPAVLLLWILTVWGLWRLYRRRPGSDRLVAGLLALHWAWAGAVYHLVFFRRINPAAALFGVAFLLQAALLLWRGAFRPHLSFTPSRALWGRLALGLIVYALFYPKIGWLFGLRYPRLPSFGVPCPTTILTAGLLFLAPRREARLLGVIPVLWAGVGGAAAFLLGIRADLALLLAGLLLLIYMLSPERRAAGDAA